MTVMIDKYVIKTEQSPKVLIYDNELQRHIVSVNTTNAEHNTAIAEIILQELNTGKYEVVEDDSGYTGDISNSDNGGLHTGDNSSNDGVIPIDESEGNNGSVESDNNNDTNTNISDSDVDDKDLNNG